MTRIKTVSPERARGVRRVIVAAARRQYGGVVPGILRVLLVDLRLALLVDRLYSHLNLSRRSPMTRLQREMVATVVNGLIGGAP